MRNEVENIQKKKQKKQSTTKITYFLLVAQGSQYFTSGVIERKNLIFG